MREAGVPNCTSSLIKNPKYPSAEIQTDVKNQYNKKASNYNHAEYKSYSLAAYDTVDSAWVILLMRMYAHLFSNLDNLILMLIIMQHQKNSMM